MGGIQLLKTNRRIYTGHLTYKDIEFTFVFDEKELRLIPPPEKMTEVSHWLGSSVKDGPYLPREPILEKDYMSGICNSSRQEIIFLVRRGSYMNVYGSILVKDFVLIIKVFAYIVCKYNYRMIDRISFTNPEINVVHPVNEAIQFPLPDDFEKFDQSGVMSVTTKDFDSTTTEKQKFCVNGKNVSTYFTISRIFNVKTGEPPLMLDSFLMFEFDPTDDYSFIFRLWRIAKDFLRYLCYRQDVYLPTAKLSAPYTDGKHLDFATLYIVDEDKKPDIETIKSGRYIKQRLIAGHEGRILSDIAAGELYLRHLPESYRSGRNIDAARFVMITAAFEWEFRRCYPSGICKSEKTMEAEQKAEEVLQELIHNSSGKLKKLYRSAERSIWFASLQAKIEQIGKDYSDIIDIFGKHLYLLNHKELVYSNMGMRLANQRNNFAHGNLDKEFIDESLLDLIFMEYIVYALQLKYYGIDIPNIQNAINDLFHCGFMLPQKEM